MRVVGFILLLALTANVLAVDFSALRKQAAAGEVDAQYQLGEILYEARGVARDLDASRRWATQAAGQGHARKAEVGRHQVAAAAAAIQAADRAVGVGPRGGRPQ